MNSPDRLTKPLIREGDEFREATGMKRWRWWRGRFTEIKAADGPDSLAFISSSKCTNEESYLMQKLARAVIGTNNMDNCSRYCQAPATIGLFRTVGYGGDSGSISDIEQAGLVLIIGSNTAESHPVLATRVKRAHKLRGQKLIVSDLRENEMARARGCLPASAAGHGSGLAFRGDALHLRQRAGEDGVSRPVGEWRRRISARALSLSRWRWRASDCGIPVETLKKVAHMIAEADERVHPVGDGRDAALDGLGHFDGDFEPAAGDRQLHAAGNGRVSAARA